MTEDLHQWVRHRLAAWRASVLDDAETARVAEHLAACAECRAAADAYAEPTPGAAGMHVPASLIAAWPRAQQALRGLERTLVRRHLERCAECRQDLHALGFEPRLEFVAAWESEASLEPVSAPRVAPASAPAPSGARIVRIETASSRASMRDRALIAWASVASAAAVLLLVANLGGRVTEGGSKPLFVPGAPVWTRDMLAQGPFSGLSLRIEPPVRSLSGPAKGAGEGKLNVIPVVGPLSSLALGFKPLNVPDTSLVTVSLLDVRGDTLYAVSYRQWEFRPKRFLVIDRAQAPFTPGEYALVLGSQIAKAGAEIEKTARYRFELRSNEQARIE
jgi:predicted anti-sigma-YlaC factor YlaD